MLKPSNSRIGLATIVASVAVGLFFLVGVTCAVKVCEVVSAPTEDDGDDDNPPTVSGGCDSTASTLKYYLMQAGYTETAAAAIMGNISAESCGYKYKVCFCDCSKEAEDGFKAYTLQNGSYVANQRMRIQKSNGKYTWCGFGLVQWTHDSNPSVDRLLRLQKYADGQGKEITDLEVQIEFIIAELTTNKYGTYYSKVLKPEILNKYSLKDATWRVEKWYEAPASVYGSPGYGASYATVCADSTTSWCKSLVKRVERAESALALDANCNPSSDPDTPSGGDPDTPSGGDPENPSDPSDPGEPDPVPTVPETPSGGDDPAPTTSTGALGKQNVNNAISQTNSGVEKTQWLPSSSKSSKRIGINDNLKDCCGSGCSLIAVANAYGAIHDYSSGQIESFANNLASWTKTNISAPSEANMTKMVSHVGMTYKKIWSSKSTSTSSKVAEIRSALASGGAVIAGGDRQGTDSSFCTDARKSSGECAFTPGGHYIAIIGITADDKLVVANPGKSRGKNWIFPADNVLKYSNLGYVVK